MTLTRLSACLAGAILSACSNPIFHYHCDDGSEITVRHPQPDVALLQWHGDQLRLDQTISASGARYAGEALVWWSKGGDATLYALNDDGTTGDVLCRCSSSD